MPLSETARSSYTPRRPALVAGVVYFLAALTLCWPMLAGKFLVGDDQLLSGISFRLFGAEWFRQTAHIPEWNPYIFGGLPFIAAMHGDIFYPTAWLRWILPIDTAMNIGFATHIVLAGCSMYAFLRALRLGWTGALIGGLSYELTGIIASLVSPGHDGKMFVSALAPLAFLALLRAIRHGRVSGYGLLALTVGLAMLSPHYQMTYYLLVALGLWTLYLVFFDPERRPGLRWPVAVACALGAVLLGLAVSGIQTLPFLSYIPYSPRGAEGPSTGWEYATQYAMPVEELFTTLLPQFNGVLEHYWGQNHFKTHSEYLGVAVLLLATLGVSDRSRGRIRWAFGAIAILFLLVAFGAHTPFYRLWYEVMPMMKKVRAEGMAFYLVAFVVALYAGFGADRLIRGDARPGRVLTVAGVLAAMALLGAVGVLQSLAEALAQPDLVGTAAANAAELRIGSIRLLLAALAVGGVSWAVAGRRLVGAAAAFALGAVVIGDLWSVDRLFFHYQLPAAQLLADDAITARLRAAMPPLRSTNGQPTPVRAVRVLNAQVYRGSALMAYRIPEVLGYHGNEVRFYDELWGGKGVYRNIGSPNLWDLYAVNYVIMPGESPLAGFHRVVGPVPTSTGASGVLYQRDTLLPYVRVVGAAARIPDAEAVGTVNDPRFPVNDLVVFSDTSSVNPAPIQGGRLPPPTAVRATLVAWAPGDLTIALTGADTRPTYLIAAENWYPDWHATIDGKSVPVHRADHALLGVVVPPGAREVVLHFHSRAYDIGKAVSAFALLLSAALLLAPRLRRPAREAA